MSNHERCNHDIHTNAFIDINGVPYVLAEYLDRRNIQHIDRSMIKSEIFVDQSEAMRAVIDINVDDIGKRGSDGLPAIIGNNTKQKKLIKMISDNAENLNHQLNVLRRGIILRVSYQVEDSSNYQPIRTMTEDLRILDRNYFLDINPRDVNDNAIIVNFCNSMVSTINDFTHGVNRMVFRITNIQMYYECVKTDPKMPRIKQSLYTSVPDEMKTPFVNSNEYYQYHNNIQNQHMFNTPGCTSGDNYLDGVITPPTWYSFNRFYHFDNGGRDIVFHFNEVNDPYTKSVLIPCGNITVNRAFCINPGHRIIFKFCIWKNDGTFVTDTSMVSQALRAPYLDFSYTHDCNHHHHHHDHEVNPDYEALIRMIEEDRRREHRQNHTINKLIHMVEDLQEIVKNQTTSPDTDGNEEPDIEPPVVDPPENPTPDDPSCNCGCGNVSLKIEELEKELEELKNSQGSGGTTDCGCNDIKPFPSTRIEEIINGVN